MLERKSRGLKYGSLDDDGPGVCNGGGTYDEPGAEEEVERWMNQEELDTLA